MNNEIVASLVLKKICDRKLKINFARPKKKETGAGAPTKWDSEDEDFIARSIEDKVTYHGRRRSTVMYTNQRI